MNVYDLRIILLQKAAEWQEWQEWYAQLHIGRPFKRRVAVNMHLILDAMNIARSIARRDYHHIVSAPGKIRRKISRHLWNTSNHRRILIGDDPDTHRYRSLPRLPDRGLSSQ